MDSQQKTWLEEKYQSWFFDFLHNKEWQKQTPQQNYEEQLSVNQRNQLAWTNIRRFVFIIVFIIAAFVGFGLAFSRDLLLALVGLVTGLLGLYAVFYNVIKLRNKSL